MKSFSNPNVTNSRQMALRGRSNLTSLMCFRDSNFISPSDLCSIYVYIYIYIYKMEHEMPIFMNICLWQSVYLCEMLKMAVSKENFLKDNLCSKTIICRSLDRHVYMLAQRYAHTHTHAHMHTHRHRHRDTHIHEKAHTEHPHM